MSTEVFYKWDILFVWWLNFEGILYYNDIKACIWECKFQDFLSSSNASIKHPSRISAPMEPFKKYITGLGEIAVKQIVEKNDKGEGGQAK